MKKIERVHDKMFTNVFRKVDNARALLKKVLPDKIKKIIDFSNIEIEDTDYVSKHFDEYYSDIVVKVKMNAKDGDKIPTDICFILEHKTKGRIRIFIQILKYMVEEWQKDIDEKRPLRIIIPIVFYHGDRDWKIPQSFVDQFNVEDEVKEFLLDYRYFLFDAKLWDFQTEKNKDLKDNVFLLTAMALMKYAYTEETEGIENIFRFWHEKGFTEDIEDIVFFLIYISETKNISRDQLKKMLEKSKIDGGEIMQTLADRLRSEGREEGKKEGKEEGKKEGKEEGKKEGKLETARKLIERGVDMDIIVEATGFSRQEIEKLVETIH
jgi:predicted transposase/invertase (TIGR01784 family)